jgi:hypothetical protein
VTYHYLVAEVYRVVPPSKLPYEQFWRMSKSEQADHIWRHLFVERTPVSEACRGVMTSMKHLGLDPAAKSLRDARRWCAEQDPSGQIDRVMELANVRSITMTNAVFDDNERGRWLSDPNVGATRASRPSCGWTRCCATGRGRRSCWASGATRCPTTARSSAGRRSRRPGVPAGLDRPMKAIYLALSLPPEWRHPAPAGDAVARAGQTVLEQVVLPVCAERNLPFAMMIGSKLRVNPALRDAGDMVGTADVESVVNLCRQFRTTAFSSRCSPAKTSTRWPSRPGSSRT